MLFQNGATGLLRWVFQCSYWANGVPKWLIKYPDWKPHVMWFSGKSFNSPLQCRLFCWKVYTPLVNVGKLEITIDSDFTWAYHVANVCKKMAYYLF